MLSLSKMDKKGMFDKILHWLSSSDIRGKDGAVYSWLNPGHENYVYPEIIGYYTKLFSYLYSKEGNPEFKDLAVSSANYLSLVISKNGSVSRLGIEYVFDTGICLSGILSLDKVDLLENRHRTSIKVMANFVKNSLLKRVVSLKNGKPHSDNSTWSLSYGSLLIKTAISLREYGEYANDDSYSAFADKLVKEIISKTFRGDHFSISEFHDWTYTHPHCYATEGLCFFYQKGYKEYLNIIKKSAQWLSKMQNNDGSIYNWYYREDIKKEKQGDATSQAIRIWLFIDKTKYKNNIDRAFSFLKTIQQLEGGIYYNTNSKDINSWVSMFALQALYWDINKESDFNWII